MIEIGFGAGEALLAFAQAHPETNCLGLEVHRPGVGHLLLGAHAAGLTNLRIICHDAVEVLQRQIEPATVSLVHIFFPDPWPKSVITSADSSSRRSPPCSLAVLERDGTLRLATDWEPYAQHMREVLDATAEFRNVAADAGYVERSSERPLTKFERRGQRLGHDVWDLEYRRR